MVEKKKKSEEEIVEVPDIELNLEDLELEDEEELSGTKLKALREKLKACEKEKRENLDGWQRARADFLNYKRRTDEETSRAKDINTARFVDTILPLIESFTLAMKGKAWDEADSNFKSGFQMIRAQLDQILREYNVTTINPLNAPFDPRYHEAIGNADVSDETKHNAVIETIQPGYSIGEIVIRPARVVVGNYKK